MTPDLSGSQNELVRADLAFFETPAGGAVFSVGSIAWCGALSHQAYRNNVARITGNVLRRFSTRGRLRADSPTHAAHAVKMMP